MTSASSGHQNATPVCRNPIQRWFGGILSGLLLLTVTPSTGLAATVATDQSDYPPGSVVTITGDGFDAGEVVTLQVLHDGEDGDNDFSGAHLPWTVSADDSGNLSGTWLVPSDEDELGAKLHLIATGASGTSAEAFFTDGNIKFAAVGLPPGTSVTVNFTFTATPHGGELVTTSETFLSQNVSSPSAAKNGTTVDYAFPATIGAYTLISSTPVTGSVVADAPGTTTVTGTYANVGTPPSVNCPSAITVNAAPGLCSAIVDYPPASPSGSPAPSLTYSQASGTSFPVGTTTVIVTADNGHLPNATCSFTVTVLDNQAPVPTVATLPDATGECSATIASAPTATDNCAGTVTGTTTDPLTYTTQGTHTVTWTYSDGNGNSVTQPQTVIVKDVTQPVPDVANLPTATGECSAAITSAPTATDNCVGSVTGTTTDALTYTAQGTYTVNWTYDDGHGNTSAQSQTVIVKDVTKPVPDLAALPNVTGECSATIASAPTATDNCVGSVTGTTTDALSYGVQGTYTVTWKYSDGHGNCSTQTQKVIVKDITAPVANVVSLPTISAQCSAGITTAPTATDNCVGPVTGTTTDAVSYSTPGTYTVTWTYADGHGNSSSQTQTVIVLPFGFNGFLPPINGADATGGDALHTLRTFKLGSTIPFKFMTTCNDVKVTTGIHTLSMLKVSAAGDTTGPVTPSATDAVTIGNQFRLTDGKWQFNLDTKTAAFSAGTWKATATLSDGSTHVVWLTLRK